MSMHDGVNTLLGAATAEQARLEAVQELQILDTPAEQAFDDLVWLASRLCDMPIALLSLVDADRQWFKARCGLDLEEAPRDVAFCSHAIEQQGLFEIEDASHDPRFVDNPFVTGAPGIRFYAGMPLVGRKGQRFGTLCVIDTRARTLDAVQREGLMRLARRAADSLERRRQRIVAESRERTLTQLLEAMPDAVVTCDASGLLGEFNKVARQWHGVDARALPSHEWVQHFDLYDPDGQQLLTTESIPLLRAWQGERVREAEIVIRAKGQQPRRVLCNADPLIAADGTGLGAVCVMHDITGLRSALDAVKVESQRFADAFSVAAQGMALVSLEGRWLEVNDATCEIFGYTRDQLLTLDFQRLTHPEDLQADLGLVADLLQGRRSAYQMDKRYFHQSGRTIHAHLSVSLVRDVQGRPLHFVSQIQDFTQQYLAQQRLRESEQQFRTVLENSHDAFISVDTRSAIVEWNRSAEATFGWRRSEVLGKSLADVIIPPHLRDAHRSAMARYLHSGESSILDQRLQMPAWHRSGHEFMVEVTISAVDIGTRTLFNAFLHDITERLEAEERVRASERRMRMVADNVPALIAHVGPDLRYRFVNKFYADWFGLTCGDIVGRHMSEILRPEHYAGLLPRLQQVLSGATVTFDMDVVNRDGEPRHMNATYIPDRQVGHDERGNAKGAGFHLMVHDLTAQIRLTRMLQERVITDALTGLPNRAAWTAALERGVAHARRAGAPAVVMFLDLDGFKQVNDTYGHAAGDVVLCEFAHRLRACLRSDDFIARLAGDEFVVLLGQVINADNDSPAIARKVFKAMKPAIRVGDHVLRIMPSIGFAVQKGPVYDASRLMHKADEAMYMAKRGDKPRFAVLSADVRGTHKPLQQEQ